MEKNVCAELEWHTEDPGDGLYNSQRSLTLSRFNVTRNFSYLISYLTTHQPSYIDDLLQQHRPSRQLRSSDHNLLEIPRMRTGFAQRSFTYSAPHIWNTLPRDITGNLYVTTNTFKKKLKTFYYTPRRMHSFTWPPRLRFRHLTDRHMAR